MDTDYVDDIALLANTLTQAEPLLHSLEQTASTIDLHVNADKTEYMCFNQKGDISTLNGGSRTLVAVTLLLKTTSICTKKKHGLLSIGYQSYGNRTYPMK